MRTALFVSPGKRKRYFLREWPLHLILLPGILMLLVFKYYPMYGVVIAFKQFSPKLGILGSPWVGLKYFNTLFSLPNIDRVFLNTVTIAVAKLSLNTFGSILLALLLNECKTSAFRRSIQTVVYMPHFISWVILGSVFTGMLGSNGLVNQFITGLGGASVPFLSDNAAFRWVILITDAWKNIGYGTIVYLAAITGIDPTLYEAAVIDGAGRFRQVIYVTLPGMLSIIVLMATLNLGKLLNAGFDQIFNLYNTLVFESSDIIDTLVYRLGIENAKFSLSTAVGLFKSAISALLIGISYFFSYRYAGYRIF